MESIKNTLKKSFTGFSANEYLILLFMAASFISVFLMAGMMILLPIYILATSQGKKALPKKKSDFLLLVFGALALFSTVFYSKGGLVNGFQVKKIYLILLGVGIILLAFDIFFFIHIMTRRAFIAGLKLSALMSIFTFLVALYQIIFKIYPDPIDRPGRVASLYINENYYGTALEYIILIALFLLFSSKNIKSRAFYTSVLIINVVALWFCQTRTAFVVLAVSVFLFLFVYSKRASYIILLLIAALALVILKFPSILPRFETISSYMDFRMGIWKCAMRSFLQYPFFGRGYFSYSAIWLEGIEKTAYQALHAHNLYIEMLINFGVLGSLPLLLYCITRIKSCIKASLKKKDTLALALILSSAVALVLHGLTDTTIFWPQTGFFAVYLLAAPKAYEEEKR